MSEIVLGVDLGTTTITALALEPISDTIVAQHTLANDAEITPSAEKALGRSEWDPQQIILRAQECLRSLADRLGARTCDVAAIGITGQQHGVLLVDPLLRPLTPLVNWQDRRGNEPMPGEPRSFTEEAVRLIGEEANSRSGCRLATGYMGITLFWWQVHKALPRESTAIFVGDYLASVLTGQPPISDPTDAASSGLLDVHRRCWDPSMLEALGLPKTLFPELGEATRTLGPLSAEAAAVTDLPKGIPVHIALGDCQAAFLGSVADPLCEVLVNIGTGAQVLAATDRFLVAPAIETRPLPQSGNLLVCAQPCGGRAYAILNGFFQSVLRQLGGLKSTADVYDAMNRLAESVPTGSHGLQCMPFFAGTRSEPNLRGSWTGVSPENFTPGHMARALLEGMVQVLHDDYQRICQAADQSYASLVGAGNGLRRNELLRKLIEQRFTMPLRSVAHQEEAAVGAARVAAAGAGILPPFTSRHRAAAS